MSEFRETKKRQRLELMIAKQTQTWFFAAIIVFAHLKCMAEHCPFVADDDQIDANQVEELFDSLNLPDSDQEEDCGAGCICKGAMVAPDYVWQSDHVSSSIPLGERALIQQIASTSIATSLEFIPFAPSVRHRCALWQRYLL